MRKVQLLGVTLLAMFAFGVLTVASASGAISTLLAEWLWEGSGVSTELLVDAEGELLLEDTLGFLLIEPASVLCSGILDGWVGPNGSDLITELLSLNGSAIPQTELVEPGLECVNELNCIEPLVWALNLPWKTLLELVVDGTEEFFAILITEDGKGEPGWYVECMGPKFTDDCHAPTAVMQAVNEGTVVDATFSEAFTELMELELGVCTQSMEHTGVVEGLGLVLHAEGGTLAVSE